MKKRALLCTMLLLTFPMTAHADIVGQIQSAESALGIDNSEKKTVERVEALEDELGLTAGDKSLADRVSAIEEELGISEGGTETGTAVTEQLEGETEPEAGSEGSDMSLVDQPSDDFVMERLGYIDTITDMAPVTEDHDPNGQLNKPGGYIGCVYFSDKRVELGGDVIEVGTDGGGAIEVFSTSDDAEKRNTYLAAFDGTMFASGSHKVLGTCVVRTSSNLTASEQEDLTDKIVTLLTAVDPEKVEFAVKIEASDDASTTESVKDTLELYNQDGYSIRVVDFHEEPYMGPTLTLTIQNLTHHDVSADIRDVNVNGAMINTGGLFSIAAGKEQTSNCYFMWDDLKDAGITEVEEIKDITFSVDVFDSQTYQDLASIGPFYLAIDKNGNVVSRTVYNDRDTIREVQSLLNAAGYDVGSADGIAGKNTNNMILQYERDHGLPEDTDITDELLEELRKN